MKKQNFRLKNETEYLDFFTCHLQDFKHVLIISNIFYSELGVLEVSLKETHNPFRNVSSLNILLHIVFRNTSRLQAHIIIYKDVSFTNNPKNWIIFATNKCTQLGFHTPSNHCAWPSSFAKRPSLRHSNFCRRETARANI